MTASITYAEVQNFIFKHYNIRPELSMADNRAICLAYSPGSLFPTIKVDVRVESIQGNTILLTYSCAPALALMVQGALALMGDKIPVRILRIDTQTRTIHLFIDKIDQLKTALEYISLQDVSFDAERVNVELAMR